MVVRSRECGVLQRRKSIGDTVLERNICFVDTPGCSPTKSRGETMEKTLAYVGEQAKNSFSATPGGGDVVGLLSGHGGTQVDLVLYLLTKSLHTSCF